MLHSFLSKYASAEEQQQALEQLAVAHPYFTPAQFHLLLTTNASGRKDDLLAAKNAVLFNNPRWLNFQLAEYAGVNGEDERIEGVVPVDETPVLVPVDELAIEETGLEPAVVEEPEQAAAEELLSVDEVEQPALQPQAPDTPLLKEILNKPAAEFSDELPAFQPLFSSDYFASQGIKLSEEVQPTDKLGKQLKSFTEWLKGMKKIHPEKVEDRLGTQQPDLNVQKQAEKSNSEDAVLTEAMAEVLLLQGKPDKALDIYHKLSLLNPAKSAYFAAKIEQLKRS